MTVERTLLEQAMTRADGNKSAGARLVDQLYTRIDKHGLR